MNETKEKILREALTLFNEKGPTAVKTRDIARATKISLGNLTYYFPTKNDIVLALTEEVAKAIDEALERIRSGKEENSLLLYYQQVRIILEAQLKYKFLFKMYGEIITSFPQVQEMLQDILRGRFKYWDQLNRRIVEEGLAIEELVVDAHSHSYIINMLALFWHQEFAIYFPELDDNKKVQKALAIYFHSYKPYLTAKGKSILIPHLEKLKPYN